MSVLYEKVSSPLFKSRIRLDKLRNASVLVTGANGLLASHLIYALSAADKKLGLGLRVSGVTRGEAAPWMRTTYDGKHFTLESADLAAADIRTSRWFKSVSDSRWDFVIHAATYGQPKKFLEDALGTVRLNTDLTRDLLEITARAKGTFLFMSTSELYGTPANPEVPLAETAPALVSPLDARAAYSASRLQGEVLCRLFQDGGSVKARVARVSSVFGPGTRLIDDRVLNVFILRAIREGAIKMMDPGLQRRKWLYISDALQMFFHILLDGDSLLYNVSGSEEASIARLAEIIGSVTGAPVSAPAQTQVAGHTTGTIPLINIDNTKILREAGIDKLTPLKDAIADTVAWYRELNGGPAS